MNRTAVSLNQNQYGTVVPVGSTWVPRISTQDASGRTFAGSMSVPLVSNPQVIVNYHPPCNIYGRDPYGYFYSYCVSQDVFTNRTFGYAQR